MKYCEIKIYSSAKQVLTKNLFHIRNISRPREINILYNAVIWALLKTPKDTVN